MDLVYLPPSGPNGIVRYLMDCVACGYYSREDVVARLRELGCWPVRLPLYHEAAGCWAWLAEPWSADLFGVDSGSYRLWTGEEGRDDGG